MEDQSLSDIYFEKYKSLFQSKQEVDHRSIKALLVQLKALEEVNLPGPAVYFMINFNTMKYDFVNHMQGDICGYPASDFSLKGVRFHFQVIHPDDARVLVDELFPDFGYASRAFTFEERKSFSYELNYRMIRKDGKTINALEQAQVILFDGDGRAQMALGRLIETESFGSSHVMKGVIRKRDQSGATETVFQKNYYPSFYQEKGPTNREKEILAQLIHGKSSREIADLLCISINTVDTHRRNLLRKMGKKTTAELIAQAIKMGI